MDKVYLKREFSFDAAHHLPNYEGACSAVHGHSYRLEVTVSGFLPTEEPQEDSSALDYMVIDFVDIKKIVKDKIMTDHDHANLNDIYYMPLAEVMAIRIFNRIKKALAERTSTVVLESVKLWETSNCCAEYKGEIS